MARTPGSSGQRARIDLDSNARVLRDDARILATTCSRCWRHAGPRGHAGAGHPCREPSRHEPRGVEGTYTPSRMAHWNSVICGSGMYLPETIVPSEEFAACLPMGVATF